MIAPTNLTDVVQRRICEIVPSPRNARTHSRRQIRQIANSIEAFGFLNPILVDETDIVLAGHGRLAAAKLLGMTKVPTLQAGALSEAQKRAFVLAENKIAENAGWDRSLLAAELGDLAVLLPQSDLNLSLTGFEAGEVDVILTDFEPANVAREDAHVVVGEAAVSLRGDLWCLGPHRLLCGDARSHADVDVLMGERHADMVFTDPPYNVPIAGHVQGRGRTRHQEFACASGELTNDEFNNFLTVTLRNAVSVTRDGALAYVCMDWRHIGDLIGVGKQVYDSMLNLCVWTKSNGGQGSFYRSQHELIGVFRLGDTQHQNNVELGRFGRNRSNVWSYPSVNSFGNGRDATLESHPTVKPVALVADAIRDCTDRNDLIFDPFLGSGTTLLAAEKVGRRAAGLEIEPRYVDCAIRRWQAFKREDAILDGDGRTFSQIEELRSQLGRNLTPKTPSPPFNQGPSRNEPSWFAGESWIDRYLEQGMS